MRHVNYQVSTLLALILMAQAPAQAVAQTKPAASAPAPGWAAQSAAYKRLDGLLPLFVDATGGRVFMQLPPAKADGVITEVLHHTLIKEGMGSASVRPERGQFGPTRLLQFRKIGGKVLAEYKTPEFKASGTKEEAKAVEDAFANSAVWAGPVVTTLGDGSVIVDITAFLTRDAWGMRDSLNRSGQGTFRAAPELTLADTTTVKAFPDNLEMDAIFSFASENPGREISNIASDPTSLTFTLHHSFIRLPDAGYVPRVFDPRTAENDILITDFSTPLGQALVTRLARRFRLEKTDPSAARSTVKKPIVFYVDNSAPEPIRSALVDGAMWWKDAFEAAGYIDAYRVEVLPEGVDPMDTRYNVIFWANRLTRSWSYGQTVTDPRTGEIVRGAVILGSQRIRQNIIMFETMLGVDKTAKGGPNDPVEIALARARQLSAHEVGHALGFQHNFAGSGQGRTSVMDYPVAKIDIKGDALDFADAYAIGIGEWDKFSVDALYGAEAGLKARIDAGAARLRFRADIDGRADSTGNPYASSWDNGADPVAEITHLMQVRRIALDDFGLNSLPDGVAVNELRRRLVPVFLLNRYQVSATAKLIGGTDYAYPVKGGGAEAVLTPVPISQQSAALDALIATLKPSELTLSDAQLKLLAAQTTGDADPQYETEIFGSRMGRSFDPGVATETAAEVTLSALFAPERLNRLAVAEVRDGEALKLEAVLDRIISAVFAPSVSTPMEAEAARRVQMRTVLMLARHINGVALGTTPGAIAGRNDAVLSPVSAAVVSGRLKALGDKLKRAKSKDALQAAQDTWLAELIADPEAMKALLASGRYDVRIPPGEPI
ncbi:zinc-dependent metalloprotease [Asticcacaulis sp. ZE23SCel15]|uniref:zinc-dependent metalloprotease n=1 Tax=Asticcacaulis sp. ZE23SCel15 TaxID=3059027 RepID=UPI00265FC924|nr:zinc-dependent metalloprotease [Asticcacaulis sp. ZE23SCel15]WKL57595.1 zinc-dependent metalloprotease [Asticcacaulis sp. ZE23SCel15]